MGQRLQIFIVARISPRSTSQKTVDSGSAGKTNNSGDDQAPPDLSKLSIDGPPEAPVSTRPQYRCVFALHHHCLYGINALRTCLRIISSIKDEASTVAAEISSLNPVAWESWGSDSLREGGIKDFPCPFVGALVLSATSWNPNSGLYSPSALCRPPWVHYSLGDNNDGLTVIDITNPKHPTYAFLWIRRPTHELLSAPGYLNKYSRTYQPSAEIDSIISSFTTIPMITGKTICEIWPSQLTVLTVNEMDQPDLSASHKASAHQALHDEVTENVRTLKGLTIERLVTTSLEDGDASWFDPYKMDMPPYLPKALFSHLLSLAEQGVDVTAGDLLSRLLICSYIESNVLDLSAPPYISLTGDQTTNLLKKAFASSDEFAKVRHIKELNLSNNAGFTNICIQKILATIPNSITIGKLINFGAPLFHPAKLRLSPRVTNDDSLDVFQVQNSSLSEPAFKKDSSGHALSFPYDFTNITSHPTCTPSPGTVYSMVIFFPKFQSDVVPMRIPFAFAHHISTTIALLNFFKCLCNTSFSFPDIYPGAAVQIFRNCNPVNIHEGHGHNQSSRYDYTGRNRTFGEAKQEFIKSVLDKEGSQGWILLLLLCPTSSMLRWYRTIKYGFVRKDGEKLTILSIPEIWRIHGMKDLELAEPSKKLWESEVGKGFVKGWGCHIPIELLTEEDIQKLEKWDGLSTIVLICQNRGIA